MLVLAATATSCMQHFQRQLYICIKCGLPALPSRRLSKSFPFNQPCQRQAQRAAADWTPLQLFLRGKIKITKKTGSVSVVQFFFLLVFSPETKKGFGFRLCHAVHSFTNHLLIYFTLLHRFSLTDRRLSYCRLFIVYCWSKACAYTIPGAAIWFCWVECIS